MDDESYFKVDGNEWQQQSYYESEAHPVTEDVNFIRKTKLPAKVLLWLAVSESGTSTHKFIQKHHKNEKIVF
jgi:phosphomevalonate kinase